MEKVRKKIRIKKITILVLIIGISFWVGKRGLCSEGFNWNVEHYDETEMLPPPPDDYAELEAKIQQMSEELTYKNMQAAKKAQGYVNNPGIIKGKLMVTTAHSDVSERHSGDTIVYIENVNSNNYKPVQKMSAVLAEHIAFTKERELSPESPIMDQWNVEFIPHILPVLKGSIVDFPNTDTVRHNVYSPVPIPGTQTMLSLGTYDPEVIKTIRLDNTGEIPLRCNVHQEMSAFIVVLGNPYFTLTNKKGEFVIDNIPPGKYTLKTWHEKFKPVSIEVTVTPNQTVEVELPTISEKR
jgi:plastocyanin